MILQVIVLWIVNLWLLFFADFLMLRALFVKNYQIKILEMFGVLSEFFALVNAFSIQHEANQDSWKY